MGTPLILHIKACLQDVKYYYILKTVVQSLLRFQRVQFEI